MKLEIPNIWRHIKSYINLKAVVIQCRAQVFKPFKHFQLPTLTLTDSPTWVDDVCTSSKVSMGLFTASLMNALQPTMLGQRVLVFLQLCYNLFISRWWFEKFFVSFSKYSRLNISVCHFAQLCICFKFEQACIIFTLIKQCLHYFIKSQ